MSSAFLARVPPPAPFRPDTRFAPYEISNPSTVSTVPLSPDPVAAAFARGVTAGEEQAKAECEKRIAASEARCAALLQKLAAAVATETEALADRLRETVLALCEGVIVPLAAEPEGLAKRCTAAAALLAQTQGERVAYLHPEDAVHVAPLLAPGITVCADPTLGRGALRLETPDGGAADGPVEWRRALAEALGAC